MNIIFFYYLGFRQPDSSCHLLILENIQCEQNPRGHSHRSARPFLQSVYHIPTQIGFSISDHQRKLKAYFSSGALREERREFYLRNERREGWKVCLIPFHISLAKLQTEASSSSSSSSLFRPKKGIIIGGVNVRNTLLHCLRSCALFLHAVTIRQWKK